MARYREQPKVTPQQMDPLYEEDMPPEPGKLHIIDDEDATVTAGEADAQLAKVKSELEAAIAARQRALADFANYQRRAMDNEGRARRDGMNQIARQLVPVLDSFDLALGHDVDQMSAEQLASGLRMVHETLLKVLAECGMKVIEPQAGEAFNASMHEAMLKQEAEGVEPGHVVKVFQPGYMLGETVLRPAKVSIAPGAA
jgi:molecular chaperone GrpE